MKVMLDKGAFMPESAHKSDVGYDLRSPVRVTVPAKRSAKIDTGVHIQLSDLQGRYGGFLKSKSGLNVKHGILSEGVIDPEYTGSIVVNLHNHSDVPYTVEVGDKITQLCIIPFLKPDLELVDSLEETDRGANGFGSTGR